MALPELLVKPQTSSQRIMVDDSNLQLDEMVTVVIKGRVGGISRLGGSIALDVDDAVVHVASEMEQSRPMGPSIRPGTMVSGAEAQST